MRHFITMMSHIWPRMSARTRTQVARAMLLTTIRNFQPNR